MQIRLGTAEWFKQYSCDWLIHDRIQVPSSDCFFMSLAYLVSTKSKDPRTKAGAVLVFDDNSFASGYNGCARYFDDSVLSAKNKNDFVIHAESNAFAHAGLDKCRMQRNLRLYVTFKCCPKCLLQAVQYGVKEIVYRHDYQSTVNNEALFNIIHHNGNESHQEIFSLRQYHGPLLFEHNHMGVE